LRPEGPAVELPLPRDKQLRRGTPEGS
jgi:hypothetical protein